MIKSRHQTKHFINGECVSGSIHKRKDTGAFFVVWYDPPTKKQYKVYRYRGEKIFSKRTAFKLLAQMQGDVEKGVFNIENYTGRQTDVIPFIDEWIKAVGPGLAPGTLKTYQSYIRVHIKPFFNANPVPLVEVKLDVLTKLKNDLSVDDVTKLKILYCMHAFLDYAWRAEKIIAIPPFPKRNQYQIQEPEVKFLLSDRQQKVFDAIPEEHRPIFYWMKTTLRRPGEAMALHREDYRPNYEDVDGSIIKAFVIKRAISARKLVNYTKTKKHHTAPCTEEFEPYLEQALKSDTISPYLFTNKTSKYKGKRYSSSVLNRIAHEACKAAGEEPMNAYPLCKHSGFSQLAIEEGYSDADLQVAGGHADIRSVKKYRALAISARKRLLERKKPGQVIPLKKQG